jgi:hypothetical protein
MYYLFNLKNYNSPKLFDNFEDVAKEALIFVSQNKRNKAYNDIEKAIKFSLGFKIVEYNLTESNIGNTLRGEDLWEKIKSAESVQNWIAKHLLQKMG